jgi:hypothetical protein
MRLAKRRNNPNNNKKQRTPTNSSRCTSSASDEPFSDAAAGVDTAADAAATPASGSRDLSAPCNLASFGDVWAQNALPAQDAYMQGCSAYAAEQEQQLPSSPMTKVSSDSSGSSTQHCSRGVPGLAPISTAVSAGDTAVPQLAGAGGMAVEVNLMLSSFDLTASSAACCGGAAAVLAGFNAYTPPHLKHALQGVDDAESLQLMLESELIAAALRAAIASRGSAALNTESREASQKLAAVLVQDSGLFIEASDRELSTAVPAPVAAAQLTCAPLDQPSLALQAHAMCKQDSMTGSCLSEGGSVSHMAFLPPASAFATPWGCHGASIALGGPKVLGAGGHVMMAAPACLSNRMPAHAAPAVAWPAQLPSQLGAVPRVPHMPCFSGVGAQLPSILLGAYAPSAGASAAVAGAQAAVGQLERLQELRQQVVQLQCRLQDLRWHLGL